MSDYQTVTVKKIEKNAVTIEVVENFSSRAVSCLIDTGERRGIRDGKERTDEEDVIKIGAMLLFGEKAMNGDVDQPEDGGPEEFVTKVTKIEATKIGDGDSKNSIYRALLRVEVKKAKHTKLFEVGESFGAVADIGGDFEDIFG